MSYEIDTGRRIWGNRAFGNAGGKLTMQRDGTLVSVLDGAVIWSVKTNSPGAYLIMQSDRNIVIYSASGVALWETDTNI